VDPPAPLRQLSAGEPHEGPKMACAKYAARATMAANLVAKGAYRCGSARMVANGGQRNPRT